MIRDNQIDGLTGASKHKLIAGLVLNYRERNNATYFIDIERFNKMKFETNKKSFNISDLEKYGATKINSEKKRSRYKYDIDNFIVTTKLKI